MGVPTTKYHRVSIPTDTNFNALVFGSAWDVGVGSDGTKYPSTTLTYSFPASSAAYGTGQGTASGEYPEPYPFNGLGALTGQQQAAAARAFALVTSYTGLTFASAADSGAATRPDIRLANANPTPTQTSAIAWGPWGSVNAGDVFFLGTGRTPQVGNHDFAGAVLHEIGHALGLQHGQEPGYFNKNVAPSGRNDTEYAVMNYASYIGANTNFATNAVGSSPQTFMMDDIAGLQYLYGANFGAAGTDVTYKWSETTGEEFVDGRGQGAPVKDPSAPADAPGKIYMTLWTEGANSTCDLSNFNGNCTLDMRPGRAMRFSDAQLANLSAGDPNQDPTKPILAQGNVYNALLYKGNTSSEISSIVTGNGTDTVFGNDRFNQITLGNGNNDVAQAGDAGARIVAGNGDGDTLTGGGGNDTFVLTGGAGATVTGGSGTNVLDLSELEPRGGGQYQVTAALDPGTQTYSGTLTEGAIVRATFTGITTFTNPNNVPIVPGGAPPSVSAIDPGDVAEAPAPAGAGQAGVAAAAGLAGQPALSYVSSDAGTNAVRLSGAGQAVLLRPGALERVSGFNPASDVLDLTQILAGARLGPSDVAQLGRYLSVADSGGNATLSLNPDPGGGGAAVALATLVGVGPNVTLATLAGDGALKVH